MNEFKWNGKYLSDTIPTQNGLKNGDALFPLLFNFAFEYAIRRVQDNQVGFKLKTTHQLVVYADDVNLMEDNINTRNSKKITDALTLACKRFILK
jgi:hypothetical protein